MRTAISSLVALAATLALTAGNAIAGGHEQTDHSKHDMKSGEDHSQHQMKSGMDHSGHDMAGHSTARDEQGRRLYGMKHNVTPEIADQLRERIPGWEKISDQEINLSMTQMGSNYEWYISPADVTGETGVLLLLHGFRERGDKIFKDRVQQYGDIFPMAMSFGMSMMMSDHIQLALDDLVAAGAKNIVVIPMVSTEHNTMIRQWQYIFGLEEKASYADVKRVSTPAKIYFADPPNDDPAVAEILTDHALELSENPDKEVVIIAAHGPSMQKDNEEELKMLENLAGIIKEDGGFSAAYGVTLQDDAPPAIRDANVAKLRGIVEKAKAEGKDAIVVTNLMGSRTIQSKLRKDLKGLDYKFNAKGLVAHDKFVSWIGETVRDVVERERYSAQSED